MKGTFIWPSETHQNYVTNIFPQAGYDTSVFFFAVFPLILVLLMVFNLFRDRPGITRGLTRLGFHRFVPKAMEKLHLQEELQREAREKLRVQSQFMTSLVKKVAS